MGDLLCCDPMSRTPPIELTVLVVDSLLTMFLEAPLCRLSHDSLAALRKSDYRRRGARAFRVFKDDTFAPLHDRHAGIRSAEVNAKYFAHKLEK